MSNSEVMAMLTQGLHQAQAIRGRLTMRLEELRRDIDQARKEITEVDTLISSMRSAMVRLTFSVVCINTLSEVTESNETHEVNDFNTSLSNLWFGENIEMLSDEFSSLSIPRSAAIILSRADGPLHVNEIYMQMVKGGYTFTSDNPPISIAGSLMRNCQFKKVAPNTFDLIVGGVPARQVS